MSISKATDYACYLCKKVKFFKTFDNLLKHNCRFHNCEKEDIKEKKEDKLIRLFPNIKNMFFYCVNALEKINKQIIEKKYFLKTYIKIKVDEPIFIHLDEPIFIEQNVTETIEEFEEINIIKDDAIYIVQELTETMEEFEEELLLVENITNEMIEDNFLNEYEKIVIDDKVIFIDGECYKIFDSPQDYINLKKKAYYKLSKKYHPDKNKLKDVLYYTEYFKKINTYYEDYSNITYFEDENNNPSSDWMYDFYDYMNFFDKEDKEKYYEDYDYYITILKYYRTTVTIDEALKKYKTEVFLSNGKTYFDSLIEDIQDEEHLKKLCDKKSLNIEQIYKKVDNKLSRDEIKGREASLMITFFLTYGEEAFIYKYFKKNFLTKYAKILMEDERQSDFYIKYRGEKLRSGYITSFTGNAREIENKRKIMKNYYYEELDRLIKLIENDYTDYEINDEDFIYDLNCYEPVEKMEKMGEFHEHLRNRKIIKDDVFGWRDYYGKY